MINNNIPDMSHFSEPDAGSAEHKIYYEFVEGQKEAYQLIREELLSDNPTAYKDLGGEVAEGDDNYMKIYFTNLYNILVDSGYLIDSQIDKEDDTYIAYKTDETISMKEFLMYALSKNWVNVSKLGLDGKYSSKTETYEALVDAIEGLISDNTTFNKKIYKNLIYNDRISGCEICLALFEQGVLENDDTAIAKLQSGSSSIAYDFMKEKIYNLEITPAQLAMDPCSAACTIVDSNTGAVLACVSYPSYDNNKLSGTIDNKYYNSLVSDLSSPLYNTATQAQKAPGSVFKLVTTAAALEEGATTVSEIISPEGVFTKQGLDLACWYYSSVGKAHDPLNVVGAIKESCNYYFSEMGWRLSQVKTDSGEETYNEPKGLEIIQKYATKLGFGTKTGIELNELEPHITDEAPIPSSIGQGTNLFSNVQLARYAATLANKGTVYKLTLVDKINNPSGDTLEVSEPVVDSESNLSQVTWNAIHEGMRAVTTGDGSAASNVTCQAEIAGKTGTAEENRLRPNHANFISFAPYDNPEVAIASTVIYGYSSSYAVKITSRVYDLYYGVISLEDIMNSGALDASGDVIAD